MSSIDEEIQKRLEALKSDNIDKTVKPKARVVTITSTKSSEEEIQNLIRQLSEEVNIDLRHEKFSSDVDSEIRQRLDKLKCFESSSSGSGVVNQEPSVKDIVSQYSSLAKLESTMGQVSNFSLNEMENKDDELPWCVICNENGSLRCSGCENDIYCSPCFIEFHDKEELKLHQTLPFRK